MTISDHSKFLVTTQAQTNEQHTSLLSLIGFVPYESANFFLTQKINESLSPNYLSVILGQKKVFVRKVIELHDKYLAYVNDCFMNHSLFHKTLKEAFEVFCNKGVAGSSSAELLATFCDNILKKGKKLARRLLFDKSANDDHERSILTKLKQQCGGKFTSKMEGMVPDLTLARENQANFEEYLSSNSNANPGIDLTVTVLTTGSGEAINHSISTSLLKWEFDQTRTKHRKLTWKYSLGTCNINGKFEPKTMKLMVTTTYQASACCSSMLQILSYSEIMSPLNLTDDDIVRLLHS